MHKFFVYLLLFVFFSCPLYSQNIIVQDSITKQPIPYVSVGFVATQTGVYADEKGQFTVKAGTQIKLSCIGYENKIIDIDEATHIILLKPIAYNIQGVSVAGNVKENMLGFYDLPRDNRNYYCGDAGMEYALYIPNTLNKKVTLSKIILGLNSDGLRGVYKESSYSVFRINIYKVAENQEIGEVLNTKQLIYSSKILTDKTVLDVFDMRIPMDEDGIFIGIEYLGRQNRFDNITYDKTPLFYPLAPVLTLAKKSKNIPYIAYSKSAFHADGQWKKFSSGLFRISVMAY